MIAEGHSLKDAKSDLLWQTTMMMNRWS